jgi:hypothetical protein
MSLVARELDSLKLDLILVRKINEPVVNTIFYSYIK